MRKQRLLSSRTRWSARKEVVGDPDDDEGYDMGITLSGPFSGPGPAPKLMIDQFGSFCNFRTRVEGTAPRIPDYCNSDLAG